VLAGALGGRAQTAGAGLLAVSQEKVSLDDRVWRDWSWDS
jgi:hypothetical protein